MYKLNEARRKTAKIQVNLIIYHFCFCVFLFWFFLLIYYLVEKCKWNVSLFFTDVLDIWLC